jgi:hypothetical protein
MMDRSNEARGTGFRAAWIAAAVIAAAVIAFGVTRYAAQPTTTAMTNNAIPERPSAQSQPSPQGETGPLDTKSGGAPAASPQGDAPPGMQPQNR